MDLPQFTEHTDENHVEYHQCSLQASLNSTSIHSLLSETKATEIDSRPFSAEHSSSNKSSRGPQFKVVVSNLNYRTTWKSLKDHMKTAGEVLTAHVLFMGGRPSGRGVIVYKHKEDALRAVETLDRSVLDGRCIIVRPSRPRVGDPGSGLEGDGTGEFDGDGCTEGDVKVQEMDSSRQPISETECTHPTGENQHASIFNHHPSQKVRDRFDSLSDTKSGSRIQCHGLNDDLSLTHENDKNVRHTPHIASSVAIGAIGAIGEEISASRCTILLSPLSATETPFGLSSSFGAVFQTSPNTPSLYSPFYYSPYVQLVNFESLSNRSSPLVYTGASSRRSSSQVESFSMFSQHSLLSNLSFPRDEMRAVNGTPLDFSLQPHISNSRNEKHIENQSNNSHFCEHPSFSGEEQTCDVANKKSTSPEDHGCLNLKSILVNKVESHHKDNFVSDEGVIMITDEKKERHNHNCTVSNPELLNLPIADTTKKGIITSSSLAENEYSQAVSAVVNRFRLITTEFQREDDSSESQKHQKFCSK